MCASFCQSKSVNSISNDSHSVHKIQFYLLSRRFICFPPRFEKNFLDVPQKDECYMISQLIVSCYTGRKNFIGLFLLASIFHCCLVSFLMVTLSKWRATHLWSHLPQIQFFPNELLKIMFIYFWDRERERVRGERERERERERDWDRGGNRGSEAGSVLTAESLRWCLNSWIVGSWPEPKLDT